MVPTNFLNDFEMVPVAPTITGITLVFTFHIRIIIIIIIIIINYMVKSIINYEKLKPPVEAQLYTRKTGFVSGICLYILRVEVIKDYYHYY
jgi:hypothetical protein